MNEFVQSMANAINSSLGAPLTVMLLAMIPIAEARVAIPFGMTIGLTPGEAFGYAFLGSSLLAPILLLVLIPIINALSKTKFFSKIGKFLYDKFEKKSRSLAKNTEDGSAVTEKNKKFKITKSDLKKMGGTAAFVAVPLPLTGVWTGSAVASIVKVGFVKGLIGVIVGNAAACGIITLISFLFSDYQIYITIGFAVIAVIVVAVLIVKLILYKPSTDSSAAACTSAETATDNSANGKMPTTDESSMQIDTKSATHSEILRPPQTDEKDCNGHTDNETKEK